MTKKTKKVKKTGTTDYLPEPAVKILCACELKKLSTADLVELKNAVEAEVQNRLRSLGEMLRMGDILAR